MRRFITVLAGLLIVLQLATARQTKVICGTNPERWKVELFLHRQAERARRAAQLQSTGSPTSRASAARDIGNIAVLEDGDGHFFTEANAGGGIAPIMDARKVPPHGDVEGQLLNLSLHR